MKDINVIGIDLGKRVFHVHGRDRLGNVVLVKKFNRSQLKGFMVKLTPCRVGIEACAGSHYWAREFQGMGHQVRIIPAQFVKPYLKSNKNDWKDAEAIAEAMERPGMRFVGFKTQRQLEIQSLHRIRSRVVRARTALSNEIQGILLEQGIVLGKVRGRIGQSELQTLLAGDQLSPFLKEIFQGLKEEYDALGKRIESYDQTIERIYRSDPGCQRIGRIPGIGPITATALIASIGNAGDFKNGRQMAAYLGLVPRQYSTGGRNTLLGISRRGNRYLRCLLVHGARAVLKHAANKKDPRSLWIQKKMATRGFNKACVALANKNARIVWALLSKQEEYRAA